MLRSRHLEVNEFVCGCFSGSLEQFASGFHLEIVILGVANVSNSGHCQTEAGGFPHFKGASQAERDTVLNAKKAGQQADRQICRHEAWRPAG